ncbi:MAG TPA: cytochrome P450 [Chloroflexota bacterium]|nr:cytochrome P450 [Chloroflexota bacterium]
MSTTPTGPAVLHTAPPVRIGAEHPRGGVLGLLPELSRDALGLLSRCARDYGDFVRMRLGPTHIVLISHPALVEELLTTRSHDFRKNLGSRRLGSALGNGLLVSEGDLWLRQRRLMQPAFHRQRIDGMAETMVATASKALESWQAGDRRDIYREMMDLTLQIAARTLIGTDITEDMTCIRRSSRIMTDHLRSRLFSLMTLLPDRVPTPGNLRYAAAVRDLDTLVYRRIAGRRAGPSGGEDDLLGMLLAARDDAGRGMTDRQLRDEVLTIMSAAYDTTALALTWAWVLLAKHPAAESRLGAEIGTVPRGHAPGALDSSRLTYVEQIVTETLRLYPSAWAIGREALRDTQIGGQSVRKGTTVLLSPYVLHRDPRLFDDPNAFRPERWAAGLLHRLPRFAYVPFGGGQRMCIGSGFAQLEITLLLATITQRFRIELTDPTRPVEPVPVLTLQPRGGVPVTLSAR